jgi:SAM-dependent methyltransferase
MGGHGYVHGYSRDENARLNNQSVTLFELLHSDTFYPAGAKVLEAGCGVGAQTVILCGSSPGIELTSVDISGESIEAAKAKTAAAGFTNVTFQQADIFDLPFAEDSFDHVFVCFVLEHLANPVEALGHLKKVLKPGGTITLIEGDHGSTFFYPDSEYARKGVQCLIDLQAASGGDSLIGRRLYPLLVEAGFSEVSVSPRFVYADASLPEMVDGFTKKTFAAMVQGVEKAAVAAGMMSEEDFKQAVADLYRCAEDDGTFCYTFFKARASK